MLLLAEESYGFQVLIVDEGIETGALLQPFVGRDVPVAVSTVMMMSPMRRIVLRVIVFFLLIC